MGASLTVLIPVGCDVAPLLELLLLHTLTAYRIQNGYVGAWKRARGARWALRSALTISTRIPPAITGGLLLGAGTPEDHTSDT